MSNDKYRLLPTQLKNAIDPSMFSFETTEHIDPLEGVVGQARGTKVMEFGLQINKPGYNIYVSGISGIGKTSFTHSLLKRFAEAEKQLYDWCYVYNFNDHSKPKMLRLPSGKGKRLKKDMEQLLIDLKTDIPKAFDDENYQKEHGMIVREFNQKSATTVEKLNEMAASYGFTIRQSGSGIATIPIIDGEPATEEIFRKLDEETIASINEKTAILQEKALELMNQLRELELETRERIKSLDDKVVLVATGFHFDYLKSTYESCPNVINYLHDVQSDILNHKHIFLKNEEKDEQEETLPLKQQQEIHLEARYVVHLFIDNEYTKGVPIVTASNPTFQQLIGHIEYENKMGMMYTDFTKIKPGYLHQANGGYIVIQAKDILSKQFAWAGLKRALLNHKIQMEHIAEQTNMMSPISLTPEAIPLDVKVIIIGDAQMYQLLYQNDEDFRKLFKIRADFDIEMNANNDNMLKLAQFIHTHCQEHHLLHFDRQAVAKMIEYSIRLTGHQEKLTTKFNILIDIMYEADTWATMEGASIITAGHVQKAIAEKDYRNSLYEEKIHESFANETTLIDTTGTVVGQMNGLAVYQVGQYSFGKPSRITATTFVGKDGVINIERESEMSGRLHNKGVYILAGYIGQTFAQHHPLALTAHLAFEQSYGPVDGDSASSTELYTLLSRLANIPIKQGIAVTGSVNQHGMIQPIGGVNEKIEGFFHICQKRGLTGDQGVLIPKQNTQHLMLKNEVIEAVAAGLFHIYAIETIEEGIEILTGKKAGTLSDDGEYEAGSVYHAVAKTLAHYYEKAQTLRS